MRYLAKSVLTLPVLVASLIGLAGRASSTVAAWSGAEQREVRAQCTSSMSGGPKIITNIAPVNVDKSLTSARDIIAQINLRSAMTMRNLGMTYDQNVGCHIVDPTLPWTDGNTPEEDAIHFQQVLEGTGYRLVHVDRLDQGSPTPDEPSMKADGEGLHKVYGCSFRKDPNVTTETAFESDLPQEEITKQWKAFAAGQGDTWLVGCGQSNETLEKTKAIMAEVAAEYPDVSRVIEWSPKGDQAPPSKRRTKSVFFRSPHDDERGYSGVTFDIEYQFLTCMGELHIAYSLDPESVRIGHLPNMAASSTAHYSYKGHFYRVAPPSPHVENVPLKGIVYFDGDEIGRFGDDFAGPAVGFGCFSGQTKKIADMKDVGRHLSERPTKEELAKFFDGLTVNFETRELLTSSAAEEEIRNGVAKAAAEQDRVNSTDAGDAVVRGALGDKAAEERAARRTAEEAEFQAKEKAYEEGMAEHKAAVEQYQKSLADMEAQKAANAAAAKAQEEEFARKQAAYEAELTRARQAQEDYEAKYGKPQ